MKKSLILYTVMICCLFSCRTDDQIIYMEKEDIGIASEKSDAVGMYVLCEGNMGSNKCTLDYLDFSGETVQYLRNIYAERNPEEVKELGDVGNDVKIYGSQLWMVINCSNKVEICTASDAKKITQVDVPNCRSLAFYKGNAYVTSYQGDVYRIDTLTHQITGQVKVGLQPEELVVCGDFLYVANSGGYQAPDYDHTISVVNLNTLQEERKIDVASNLHRLRIDRYGQLWVTSRGNYGSEPARLLWLTPDADGRMQVAGELQLNVSDMCIVGDSLYYLSAEQKSCGILNVRTHSIVMPKVAELASVTMPYGIVVNPTSRDFYVMDAKNYVSSGELFHFRADGSFDYKVRTGDIPGHATFVTTAVSTDVPDDNPVKNYSKYIKAVDEYMPAPGQFVNTLPEATEEDTPETMAQKCTACLADGTGQMVTLGAYGGYITFHFDHPVVNVVGQRDFAVWGNAFDDNAEPAIVMVSVDKNGNGLPDDEWFELKGSEYDNPKTIHNYQLTYTYQPLNPTPWTDNQGNNGSVPRNGFHKQEYFPLWLTSQAILTFTGARLPDNAYLSGTTFKLPAYEFGYADNQPNTNREGCSLDISWAVDGSGQPVTLTHIDFVRVYNAMNQVCGAIGETSTEITGAEDLHPNSIY